MKERSNDDYSQELSLSVPYTLFPSASELMTEDELIEFLRIPQISKAKDHHNVIENLKRMRDLPCIRISNKCLYPVKSVQAWLERMTEEGK